jgi:CRISPR/Cas system-associated exonuclease Cas4 (RecB family)
MDIMCSGGKGRKSTTECLACAMARKNPCGYDYSLLKALFADVEKSNRRSEIHVTDLTGCLRRAWYDKVDPTPEYPHETLARWLGTAVHASIEGSDAFMECELPVAADGIKGTADIVYADGRVVDSKTTRWIYPEKLPYGSHALQVNIYAYMLRRMGRDVNSLAIQYIDMSGPSKCRKCRVPVRMFAGELKCPSCSQFVKGAHLGAVTVDVRLMSDEEVLDHIQQRRVDLEAAIAMQLPPEREPGFLCGYCPNIDKCQPNLVEE